METLDRIIIILISLAILSLITFFIICIISICSLRYTLKCDKENYFASTAYIDFKHFLDYYKLNPSIYNINNNIWAPQRTLGPQTWNHIIIHFNKTVDHFYYYFWRRKELKHLNKIKENKYINECTEEYLKLVMQDIEDIKNQSKQEFKEAKQIINKIGENMR